MSNPKVKAPFKVITHKGRLAARVNGRYVRETLTCLCVLKGTTYYHDEILRTERP